MEHIDLKKLRDAAEYALLNRTFSIHPAKLLALIEVVEAALAADIILYEYMPEWYGDREWPELDNLRSALSPFREEITNHS